MRLVIQHGSDNEMGRGFYKNNTMEYIINKSFINVSASVLLLFSAQVHAEHKGASTLDEFSDISTLGVPGATLLTAGLT